MQQALELAAEAQRHGEVPVGAVVVSGGVVVGRGYNQPISAHDPTAHAEIVAMRDAARTLKNYRLNDCELFVTLEPCAMCAGAMVNARVDRLVYGAIDPKAGAVQSLYGICTDPRLNHRVEVVAGVKAQEAGALLTDFFRAKRKGSTKAGV